MKRSSRLLRGGLALLLATQLVLPAAASAHFPDVSGWAEPYVEEAFTRGLVEGTGYGLFAPDRSVTYSEFATLLTRAFFPEQLKEVLQPSQEPEQDPSSNPAAPAEGEEPSNPAEPGDSSQETGQETPGEPEDSSQEAGQDNPAESGDSSQETGQDNPADSSQEPQETDQTEKKAAPAQDPSANPDSESSSDSETGAGIPADNETGADSQTPSDPTASNPDTPAASQPEKPEEESSAPQEPWYVPYMTVAQAQNLFQGTALAADQAQPLTVMNRTEMARMIANTLQAEGVASLTDSQKTSVKAQIPDLAFCPEDARDAVLTAYAYGLLTGTDWKGTFSPFQTMTRAQAATVLVRMAHLKEENYPLPSFTPLTAQLNQGPFDVPIAGAMGYTLGGINGLTAGTPFTILGESGDSLVGLLASGKRVTVPKTYAMVNVPDVIPSMIFHNANADAALFRVLGDPIVKGGKVLTGTKLYQSKAVNPRLGREEYFMPVSYSMALKLQNAQKAAMAKGLSIVLYEGYRPAATQELSSSALTEMRSLSADVRAATSYGHFNPAYYVNNASGGIGSHQKGSAVDITLATVTSLGTLTIGDRTVQVPKTWEEFGGGKVVKGEAAKSTGNATVKLGNNLYSVEVDRSSTTTMPTPMTETSYLSGTFKDIYSGFSSYSESMWKKLKPSNWWTQGAQTLQDLMTGAGLTPLASEWWHFNDVPAYRQVTDHLKSYPGVGSFTPVQNGVMSTTWEYALRLGAEHP